MKFVDDDDDDDVRTGACKSCNKSFCFLDWTSIHPYAMRSCEHAALIEGVQRRTVQCSVRCASVYLSKGLRSFSSHSLAAIGDWRTSFLIWAHWTQCSICQKSSGESSAEGAEGGSLGRECPPPPWPHREGGCTPFPGTFLKLVSVHHLFVFHC